MWIGRNGRNRARIQRAIFSSLLRSPLNRAKTNNDLIRGHGAQSCALPKNWDEAVQAIQSFGRSFFGALDGDDGVAGGGGAQLRLPHVAIALAGRSPESA